MLSSYSYMSEVLMSPTETQANYYAMNKHIVPPQWQRALIHLSKINPT